MMSRERGENYWRMRDKHHVVHYNRRYTVMQDTRCGVQSRDIVTEPGTVGPEAVVTCIQCLGLR